MAIADINVRIGAEIKQLQKGLRASEKSLRRSARKFSDYGNQMTAAVTIPVAGFLAQSINLFDKQAQSIAQVEAGLKSTNGVAGHTSEALQVMASDLQNLSTIGDEEILQKVTANLLTFTNVANEQFPRAQQAILDMSVRLGTDLKSSALQVGKALNDPIKGVTALAKSGIQFSKSQKLMIKSLVETGKTAAAQNIILSELEKQFGGSAAAAAKAGLGPIKQFNNSMGDMMETVGGAVLPTLTVFVGKITNLFKRFDALSISTKKNIIQIALFAAAIGPALKIISLAISGYKTWLGITTALRIATLKFSFSMKGLTVAMAANPIGFMVAALAAVATGLAIAYNKSQRFRAAIAGLVSVFYEFGAIIKDTFGNLIGGFSDLVEGNFKDAGKKFQAAFMQLNPLTGFAVAGARLGTAFLEGYKTQIAAEGAVSIPSLPVNSQNMGSSKTGKTKNSIAAEAAAIQAETIKALSIQAETIKALSIQVETLKALSSQNMECSKTGKTKNSKVAMPQSIATFGQPIAVESNGMESVINRLTESEGLLKFKTHIEAVTTAFSGMGEKITLVGQITKEMLENFTPLESAILDIGTAIGDNLAQSVTDFKSFASGVLDAISSVIGGLIKQGVASAVANALTKVPFPFNIAAGAAAGGLASGLFKGLINKIKPPKLAKGGAAYGETLATIGDNVNARSNPEVVTPANTLPGIFRKAFGKDGIGGGGGQKLVAKISGRDMFFFLENEKNYQRRLGTI